MPSQSSARGKYGAQGMRAMRGPLAPVWVSSGTIGTNIPQGQAYSVQLSATDDSGVAPTYTLASGSLPTGTSLNSAGLISGTPSAAGTFTFTVNATDENGRTTTSGSLSISVQASLPTPQIWYKNSRVGQNPVTNDGTWGASYNASWTGSTTTDSGRNVWNMGSGYLQHPFFNIFPLSSWGNGMTLAAVFRVAGGAIKYSLAGSPTGSSQVIGSRQAVANYQALIWNNDGWPTGLVDPLTQSYNITNNMVQTVYNVTSGGRVRLFTPNRTNGAVYDVTVAPYTSVALDTERIGWSRGTQDSTWYLVEYMFYNYALNDTEIQQVRNYLGSTHPIGVVNN